MGVAGRHGLPDFEILGRLIRLQALGGLGDFAAADAECAALDRLGERRERPLVAVFTCWYRAMRAVADPGAAADPGAEAGADPGAGAGPGARAGVADAEWRYRDAARLLDGCGMPGVAAGLPALARLCYRVWRGVPARFPADTGWGPYEPWARPWLLLGPGDTEAAAAALAECPEPPPGLLSEALWCLTARAAAAVGDQDRVARARSALRPAAAEIAGAGSGMLTAGPVAGYLA